MKIMICGSMKFAKDMVVVKKELDKLGHKAFVPYGTKPHLKDEDFVEKLSENLPYCIKNNVMKNNFKLVSECDAILVLNKKRNKINGYIGISALMEMAVAHHLGKKVFLLNDVPDYRKHRFAHEVRIMQPILIDGDLSKIK
jgi:hypothetical protein